MILTTDSTQMTTKTTNKSSDPQLSTSAVIPAALIIVAAGASTRMGGGIKKEYLPLDGGTVLSKNVQTCILSYHFTHIIIAVPAGGQQDAQKALGTISGTTAITFVDGGSTRQQSVCNALDKLQELWPQAGSDAVVLIHDGARPFVTPRIIQDVIAKTAETGAAVPALQPTDTQKETDGNGIIIRHLQRDRLAAVQTPQGFTFLPLLKAHHKAAGDGRTYTDDTEIWGAYTGPVAIVPGDSCNKKITYPEDMPAGNDTQGETMTRIGLGYDLHRLTPGRRLMLGGVHIPFDKGEDGHSDGDVLLHAITDALLGAAGMGDIGAFFPPSDPQWKDADSAVLLKTVWDRITENRWQLGNLDCVIALEQPKFLPWRDQVRESIADILGVSPEQIFVKAKTGEKLGKIGRGEAVEVWATCLLEK